MNGLDLFSGIGGITSALRPWVTPVAYCDNHRYSQAVLLQKIANGEISNAPIWDDIRTLRGEMLPNIDIVYGGFPCQDISVAGTGKGLAGERSGLFYEIMRLVEEVHPAFVFLENVPAIRTRGLAEVIRAFSDLRYDCRWTCISANEIGAPHLRKRWFLLAHSDSASVRKQQQWKSGRQSDTVQDQGKNESSNDGEKKSMADATDAKTLLGTQIQWCKSNGNNECSEIVADTSSIGSDQGTGWRFESQGSSEDTFTNDWWSAEPDVGRVADGVSNRVDRLRSLGNSVVPLQARQAFIRLLDLQPSVKDFTK